jgi:hypothetical protein
MNASLQDSTKSPLEIRVAVNTDEGSLLSNFFAGKLR